MGHSIPFNVIFLDQSLAVAFWQCVQCRDPEGIFTVQGIFIVMDGGVRVDGS
jgi:hypothetical protein